MDKNRIKRRRSIDRGLVIAAFFILTAVWADSPPAPAWAETKAIRIGATLPLSGRLAYVGEDIRRGIELGISDFGSQAVSFTTIYDDNQHDSKKAASSSQKLLEHNDLDVLISLWDMADVVAPIAERKRTPHLAIRWNPHIAEKYSYTVTMESTYRSYVESQIRLLQQLGAKSAGLITEEGQGWVLAADYFKHLAPGAGIAVVGDERFPGDEHDHRAVILRLLKRTPHWVVMYCNPPHTELIIRRLRELAPRQIFTGYYEYLQDFSGVEGIPFVAQFAAASWFTEKFHTRYGQPFQARAPQAYDLIKLLALVQNAAPEKLTGAALIESLSLIRNVSGASGMLSASPARNIESNCVWRIARDGKLMFLDQQGIAALTKTWPASKMQAEGAK